MKKTVLFSALILSASLMFAQAPTTIAGAIAKPDARKITMAQQGGTASANAHNGGGTWTSSNGGWNNSGGHGGGGGGNGGYGGYGGGHGSGHDHNGGHGSGYGHGNNGGYNHNSGHNHAGPCSNACGASSGGGYGQNGFCGGQCGVTPGYGNGMNSVPMCGMCSGYHAMNIVCEREFGSIATAIANRTFECDKILVAKQAIGGKLVSADQVRRFMGLFTFESTKLEFAKWAYHSTIDPQNYYIVNDGFTFSSSIRDLDEFIRRS